MKACDCKELHERRRVVLTGGPGAGNPADVPAALTLARHVRRKIKKYSSSPLGQHLR